MSTIKNPLVFPSPMQPEWSEGAPGMLLRDYFAGPALVGMGVWMPATTGGPLHSEQTLRARARWAYDQADAMLAERATGSDQ